jgi:anthranilate phosphoribosyltransferase
MSHLFRDLLKKVGSGSHTHTDLTRTESADATRMMLQAEATPAQIGAFMIAHRIKRPTGEELAGMLDAYDELGGKLEAIAADYPAIVMGIPYDGRSRTSPISPITALILTAAGCPVVQHGGRRMPTKEGVPLVELWQALGVDWAQLSLAQSQSLFAATRLGFVYLPVAFPQAETIVDYREQLGKRPPFATLELFWSPYQGDALVTIGYVHPPTEGMARVAFGLRDQPQFMTVKGLEGSCDLPCDRTSIIGIPRPEADPPFDHLLLHPRDYGFAAPEVPLMATADWAIAVKQVLQGESSPLAEAAIWNAGFYLWRSHLTPDLETGLAQARLSLQKGQAAQQLVQLQQRFTAVC